MIRLEILLTLTNTLEGKQIRGIRKTITKGINVLSFDHQVCFLMNIFGKRSDLPFFTQDRSQEGEKHAFVYAWEEYYLQPNTVGRHCA